MENRECYVVTQQLHDLCYFPGIFRVIKSRSVSLARHAVRIGDTNNVHKFLVGKPEGKILFGRPSHRYSDCTYLEMYTIFYGGGVFSLPPNPQDGGPPPVACPRLLIQYIRNYPPYLETVSSIRNLRTHHTVVTRDPLNM
jgi:hypothetical protein